MKRYKIPLYKSFRETFGRIGKAPREIAYAILVMAAAISQMALWPFIDDLFDYLAPLWSGWDTNASDTFLADAFHVITNYMIGFLGTMLFVGLWTWFVCGLPAHIVMAYEWLQRIKIRHKNIRKINGYIVASNSMWLLPDDELKALAEDSLIVLGIVIVSYIDRVDYFLPRELSEYSNEEIKEWLLDINNTHFLKKRSKEFWYETI